MSTWRSLKLDLYFSSCIKINSKRIKDLNIRPETLKLLEETIRETPQGIGIGNNFGNQTPIVFKIRARTDKWDCIKLKSFYTAKETMITVKRQPTGWKRIFAS
jgi:hypothetical protein